MKLDEATPLKIRVSRWAGLVIVALVGSAQYGASLALVLPGWGWSGAAIWLTLSAGLAWCLFIPALVLATRLSLVECIEASLRTMAAGEVILASGTAANLLLWRAGTLCNAEAINLLIVAISNVTMAAALATQLRRRVPVSRTVAVWMLALNGSGAVFFAAFHRICLAI